jgi:hypothetical protein
MSSTAIVECFWMEHLEGERISVAMPKYFLLSIAFQV